MEKFTEAISHMIVHCSDSAWGTEKDIKAWHKLRGFTDTGYHFLINNGYIMSDKHLTALDGQISPGRSITMKGAHCKDGGMNHKSIGVCLIGKDKFTPKQMESLVLLHDSLCAYYGTSLIVKPHSAYSLTKTCPNFNPDFAMVLARKDIEEREAKLSQSVISGKSVSQMTVGELLIDLGLIRKGES